MLNKWSVITPIDHQLVYQNAQQMVNNNAHMLDNQKLVWLHSVPTLGEMLGEILPNLFAV